MEINYLRDFVVLAQTTNYMEAADILYISQSTLSKHIMRLEKELGVQLFERTTRNVKLSQFGEILLPYAKQMIDLRDNFSDELQLHKKAEQDILELGTIADLAQYHITDVIYDFRKNCSQSMITVIQDNSTNLKESLRKKKINLAFLRIDSTVDEDLVEIPFTFDRLVVVLPSTHALANEEKIPLQSLSGEDFVLMDEGTRQHNLSVEICEQCGFKPKIAYTDRKLGNLVDMVRKGMGITLMMKQLALQLGNKETAVVEVIPCISTRISLCYLKDAVLTEPARKFIQCAQKFQDLTQPDGEPIPG